MPKRKRSRPQRDPAPDSRGTESRLDIVWRYIRALSSESRVPGPSPTPSDDFAGDPDASIAAADHQLIGDFLARRAGADAAMATRLAIVPRILGALCRRLGFPMKQHDLEDIAHDAIAIALRKLGRLRANVPLDAWLHRLCNYELSNSLRRRTRLRGEPVPVNLTSRDAATIQQLERRELLFAALEQLRPEDANIVRMHQLEGRTLAEIGGQLHLTENTVKGRYYRAIERLTDILRHHRPGRAEP